MLGINVTYIMKPGKRADFLAELEAQGIRAAVLAEEGCRQYDYFLPVEEPDRLLLMEKWTDQQAQKLHLEQPHMALVRAAKERFVLDTTLQTYEI